MLYLGIDFGKKRVGLSVSTSGKLAQPLQTIPYKGNVKTTAQIQNLLASKGLLKMSPSFVIGLPLDPNGDDTPMSLEVRKFGEHLSKTLQIPIHYHNERYTSMDAEEYISNSKTRHSVDTIAATMILQGYLNKKEGKN